MSRRSIGLIMVFLMLGIAGIQAVFAQTPAPMAIEVIATHKVKLEPLTVEDGLSQGLILGMLVDSKGYLWLATKEGLNRYDGNNIKVFRHEVDDPTSIGNNMGGELMEDEEGYIWIWLDIYGLDRFDPRTERFLHLTYPEYLTAYQKAPNKSALYNDAAGNLIIPNPANKTNDTLFATNYTVDIGRSQVEWCGLGELNIPIARFKQGKRAMRQFITYDNNVWLDDQDSLYRFWKGMPLDAHPQTFALKKNARQFINDDRTNLYSAANDTVFRFDSLRKAFIPILTLPEANYYHAYFGGDMQNRMITNCNGGKTMVTDLKTGQAIWLYPRPVGGVEMPKGRNYWLTCDHNNNIYLATPGWGVYKITGDHTLFKTQLSGEVPFLGQIRMDTRHIKNTYIDSLKPIWTHLDTTQTLDKKYYISLEQNRILTYTDDGYLYYYASLIRVHDDLVICKYHINTQKTTVVYEALIPDSYFPGIPLMLSKTDSLLWFGDRPKNGKTNLHSVNEHTGELTTYPFPIVSETAGYDFINDYYQNNTGAFWLGTIQGLFSFDTKKKTWQHFQNDPTDTTSLSENTILCILPDPIAPDSILWIGTNGGGLNKFDIKKGTFIRYTTKHGLPNNVVYSVLTDARNNFWMSTNLGLCLFNPNTLSTRNFNVAHGLPGNEFNRYEFAKAPDGSLHFGSVAGYVSFQPEDFYDQQNNNKLVINQLKLLNIPVEVRKPHHASLEDVYLLDKALEYTDELVFNHDVRMITLRFALLDLSIPTNNTYKYMLEGLNTGWVDNGNNQWATFTNLDPGSYTFKVIGRNSSGIWTAEPTTLKLTILPPWWATWWFRAAMLIVIAVFLFLLYRYRVVQVLKEERLRNQIAQDLHDEIGSTLSSVSLYAAVIQNKAPSLPRDINDVLNKIKDSVSGMMESMNDIVWTISATNDSFDKVLYRMRAFAVNMTEAGGIELIFKSAAKAEHLKLDMVTRKNIYLIYKEAVNNAVKYANGTQLIVVIEFENGYLNIIITDNGIGYDTTARLNDTMGGNGVRGMQLRAKEIKAELNINSIPGSGTTAELKLKIS